ncbi:MAG: SMP-30/gluconolactonase/LRE family protein, partial [Flavobacteriaceae bacterium]|nr:SMP-30/gluconolactonase/LRE family protein [Flavobacteriaceae bacterium]
MQAELEYEIFSQLGEGAFWNYETKEFFWVDIIQKRVHIYNPETGTDRYFETPSPVGMVVPASQGRAVIALEDGIYMLDTTSGAIEPLSDIEKDMPENRFNDGKCDPLGNLWVGSMHYPQNKPNASLYRVSPDGSAKRMIDSVTISNGIVWT